MEAPLSSYSEKFIQARLWDHYYQTHQYIFHNMYFFSDEYEADAIHFLENGHCWEFEIKIKKFDFFNDFDKTQKHENLKNGVQCANRFYYVTPFDLLDVKDIPEYAGLIEVNENRVRIKKVAKVLHSNLINPAFHFDRIYKKLREYRNSEMTKAISDFNLKRKTKSAYKKKKYSPKSKHPKPSFFLEK